MPGDAKEVRSPEEIAAAVSTFTHAQWAKLGRVGAYYASLHPKARCSGEDLLHEAIERALKGERRCPIGVDVVRFLAEAMRGISGDEASKKENRVVCVAVPLSGDEGEEIADGTPNAEQAIVEAEEEQEAVAKREEIMGLFKDDPLAVDMLEGFMTGCTASELRELLDIDETTYNSKRRKIRRRLDNVFPRRGAP